MPFCLLRTLLIALSSARRTRNSARVAPTMLPIPILQLSLAAHLHLSPRWCEWKRLAAEQK